MRNQYIFARKCLEVCSEMEFAEDPNSALFRSREDRAPDLRILVRPCENLLDCYGSLVWQSEFFRLFRAGGQQVIQSLDRKDGHPHMAAVFAEHSPEVILWVEKDFPPGLARMQEIWQAVSLPSQLLRCGVLSLHSASVQTDWGVLLFCGPSGAGKTTQADLWRSLEGASVLNGDRNTLTLTEDGVSAHGLPFCGTSGICHSYDLPLGAVVTLEHSAENRMNRLRGINALRALVKNALGFLPGDSSMGQWELFAAAANRVPVYHLACTPDPRAVRLLKERLEEDN